MSGGVGARAARGGSVHAGVERCREQALPVHSRRLAAGHAVALGMLAWLCALAAWLVLAAPSFALYKHEYLPNLLITRVGTLGKGLSPGFSAGQIAIDNDSASPAKGKLYVANSYPGYAAVERFALESDRYRYDCGITGPITPMTALFLTECGSVSTMPTDKEIQPTGVAVDQATGDVYVGSQGQHVVDEFAPSGNFIAEFNGEHTPAGSF